MSTVTHGSRNGVDVDQLIATVEAVKADPAMAEFQFRSHTEWVDGGRCRTTIQGFYGAGEEDRSRAEALVLEGDEPPVLLGSNRAPNAVEAVLHALAACLSVGFAYNAAAQGIDLEALEFDAEGELDLQGFLGISNEVRPGYKGIRVTCRAKTDAAAERLAELSEYVQRTSPVLDIIRNPVPVTVRVEA